jgi:putative transposase
LQVWISKACQALEVDRSTYHCKSRRPDQAAIEQPIQEICQTRVRYGYHDIQVLLRREGRRLGQNKTWRVYRELSLELRHKSPKRRVKAELREDRRTATSANQIKAMDLVRDHLFDVRRIRVLTIVDLFSRYALAIDVRSS